MESSSSAFVSGALALVLRASRVLGVAPLRFVKLGYGWRISQSRYCSLYGYVFTLITNIIILNSIILDLKVEPSMSIRMKTPTRQIVWIMDAGSQIVMACYATYAAPGLMRFIIKCLNCLQKINNELNIPHWQKRRELRKSILFIVWMLISMMLTGIDYFMVMKSIFETRDRFIGAILSFIYVFYYLCYWIMQLIIMQFMLMIVHTLESLKAVNKKLVNLTKDISDSKIGLVKSSGKTTVGKKPKKSLNTLIDHLAYSGTPLGQPAHATVHHLALTFLSICDIVRDTNKQNGPMLLLLLSTFLMHLIVSPYYLISDLLSSRTRDGDTNWIYQYIWCLFHAADLLMIVEPCHLTTEEIDLTREQIGRLMRVTSSPLEPLAMELEWFYRHLLLIQTSYAPLNVTILTRGLVVTILGTITTYLAIICQL